MRRAAVCATLLVLCAVARARPPEPPAGYERTAAGGGWTFRPAGDGDALFDIRVLAPVDGSDPVAAIKAWVAANGGGPTSPPQQPNPGIAAVIRDLTISGRKVQEAVFAFKIPSGKIQIELVRVPADRLAGAKPHFDAAAALGKRVLAGELTEMPAGGAAEPPAAAPAQAAPRDPRPLAAGIDTVGFITQTRMGIGGSLTFEPTPVVLFKSGDALTRIAALKDGDSIAALKAAKPADWTRWRRNGGVIELERKDGWKKLDYTKTMDALPRGLKLAGRYQRISGGGNSSFGGTSTIVSWSEVTFVKDGTFVSSGGASASDHAGDSSTLVTGASPDQHGSYDIDGYVLTLRYADGRVVHRLIVADAQDLDVVWLDGNGYTAR